MKGEGISWPNRTTRGPNSLVKLDDFVGELDDSWEEVRGAKVRDKNGDEVGTAEDLYVYENAEAVHLLKGDGGERTFLIPVDAVTPRAKTGLT